jgi:hypothetical protein
LEQNRCGRLGTGSRCVGQRASPNRYGGANRSRFARERLLGFGAAGYFDSRYDLYGRHARMHREQCKQCGEPVLQCRSRHFREHTITLRHTIAGRLAHQGRVGLPTCVTPEGTQLSAAQPSDGGHVEEKGSATKTGKKCNCKSIRLTQGPVRCEHTSCFSMVGRFPDTSYPALR